MPAGRLVRTSNVRSLTATQAERVTPQTGTTGRVQEQQRPVGRFAHWVVAPCARRRRLGMSLSSPTSRSDTE
jgi:hypothetical protein